MKSRNGLLSMPKKIDTNNKIRRAIVRIENGKPKIISADRKMSIKAVAEEAKKAREAALEEAEAIAKAQEEA